LKERGREDFLRPWREKEQVHLPIVKERRGDVIPAKGEGREKRKGGGGRETATHQGREKECSPPKGENLLFFISGKGAVIVSQLGERGLGSDQKKGGGKNLYSQIPKKKGRTTIMGKVGFIVVTF